MNQDVCLIRKGIGSVFAVDIVLPQTQLKPITTTVGIKACGIQTAVIKVFVTGRDTFASVCGIPNFGRNKFINVLTPRITAHVPHQRLTRAHRARPGTLMREATKCRTFFGCDVWIERINLDHPTEGVRRMPEIITTIGRRTRHRGIPATKALIVTIRAGGRP